MTGCAGFIGMHASLRLLRDGHEVVGLDCVNDYYSTTLKEDRLKRLGEYPGFVFWRKDLNDVESLRTLFANGKFDRVLHLAAQAGVRYSLINPSAYVSSNLTGFLNILECCRHARIPHLVYASSSSVYGANVSLPFSTAHPVDHPVSLYAATKRANELMAHSYSHLFNLPTTGLRFFTVYGPWGRPDMSMALFTDAISQGRPIRLFNHGNMERDFTYVDDIIEGVVRLLDHIPSEQAVEDDSYLDPARSAAPFRVYNIGNNNPVPLREMVALIEEAVGKKAILDLQDMQPGDVPATAAEISGLEKAVGFRPSTPLSVGVQHYVAWHKKYHGLS